MAEAHFLVLTFPSQGHINPALQFAKGLVRTGAHVTFATSVYAHRRLLKSTPLDGLSYASFSDGYDDGLNPTDDLSDCIERFKEVGSRAVPDLIRALANDGRPITCVVYTLLPWAADVARIMGIPSVLLWIQPAALLSLYYHYFHGYDNLIKSISSSKDPSSSIEIPGLPLLTIKELPSFLLPPYNHPFILSTFEELLRVLEKESNPRVFVNTFDELEGDVMRAVDELEMIGVGPLIPSAFLDSRETSDTSFGGDLFEKSRGYVEWLDSKSPSSVVYVSFGSISVLLEHQMAEILNGLLETNRPFLWVIRAAENGVETDTDIEFWKKVRAAEERKLGLVVSWCSQVEVLSHPSVGCFVSHCGWNSTLESLSVGVPIVGFPQWTDQPTNMKMVESVWKSGVWARVNGDGVLEGGELKRYLDMVMGGEEGEEMRKNAVRWRDLARDAAAKGGSSYRNIQAFVEEVADIR
ncbi:phloretin 4'-O-glucosyltransferase-like [Magnolia sinica]|uniref:phloretin 4'-O-glucosyltransferase-like n=1 Tax=Magnolia sinica TaxID=86752 RepID=UPI00265B40E3|nr:phloretin 4'-O-glucosyltransferase-like [Magnolia sinica]